MPKLASERTNTAPASIDTHVLACEVPVYDDNGSTTKAEELSSQTSEHSEDAQHNEDSPQSPAELRMDMVICSFALHLITPSELFALLWQLSTKAKWLIVLAPHKKPEVRPHP